jgi:uncharacterized membrane protein
MDNQTVGESNRMERLLARQLRYGIRLASIVTALGIIVAVFGPNSVPHEHGVTLGTSIIGGGIALIILLPILRVASMLIMFLHERNYLFGMISCIVLITIGVSVAVGLYMPAPS